ncbi:hypothetical protein AMATHDRAFT_50391 [Amanita thiersii Skay4041]|uniref:Uncharacterized protein n=1 Tax=Amanita thiersii Skay4041 TaxID=703135 RepID=A0A2A9N8X8_9AGAR|nr:hypothetical protein AMATHDRAFT_50391 [Amanita thiersii Skay4041]
MWQEIFVDSPSLSGWCSEPTSRTDYERKIYVARYATVFNLNNFQPLLTSKSVSYSQSVPQVPPKPDALKPNDMGNRYNLRSSKGQEGQAEMQYDERNPWEEYSERVTYGSNAKAAGGSKSSEIETVRAESGWSLFSWGSNESRAQGSSEIEVLRNEVNKQARIIEQLKRNQKYSEYYNMAKQEAQRLREDRDMFQRQVKFLEADVANLRQQLKEELDKTPSVANTFYPNTADVAAGADIVNTAEMLNHDIFQFAASLADQYEQLPNADCDDQMKDISLEFGNEVNGLLTRTRGDYSSVMQTLQTCMIACCQEILNSWYPFLDQDEFLKTAYSMISYREGQAVAGPWRALLFQISDEAGDPQTVVDTIKRKMTKALEFLGWSTMDEEHTETLKSIVESTLEMHKIIQRDVISGDIEVFYPLPGEHFNPETMKDETEGGNGGSTVHCTIEMGLKKITTEKVHEGGEWVVKHQQLIILKPKVILVNS